MTEDTRPVCYICNPKLTARELTTDREVIHGYVDNRFTRNLIYPALPTPLPHRRSPDTSIVMTWDPNVIEPSEHQLGL